MFQLLSTCHCCSALSSPFSFHFYPYSCPNPIQPHLQIKKPAATVRPSQPWPSLVPLPLSQVRAAQFSTTANTKHTRNMAHSHGDMNMPMPGHGGHEGHDMPAMCSMNVSRRPTPRLIIHPIAEAALVLTSLFALPRCSSLGTRQTCASSSSRGTSGLLPASSSASSPSSSSAWATRPCAPAPGGMRSSWAEGWTPSRVSLTPASLSSRKRTRHGGLGRWRVYSLGGQLGRLVARLITSASPRRPPTQPTPSPEANTHTQHPFPKVHLNGILRTWSFLAWVSLLASENTRAYRCICLRRPEATPLLRLRRWRGQQGRTRRMSTKGCA